ncbi:nuclear pore complex protein Nup153 isoform X1 [Ooceraea biroi]|uniref:nuclear pore complex protein Nup153 isoform X1 n=1 Tax=Ooceraea biroi TaxID=2015173 RepID=UPI000F07AC9C|nr:nuclear pore complex protein Nup153 isoform X1 [Ooceraea biroi]
MAKGSDNPAGRRPSSRNAKPYNANNSFVRKVATKVTDFIQPSWISKWFNTSQSNEDVLDSRENIEEEVEYEDDAQQAPPSKRSRIRMDVIHPPGTFSIQTRVKSALNVDLSKEQYPVHEMSEDFLEPATAGPSGIGRLISSTPAAQADVRTVTAHRTDLNSLTSPTNNGMANGADDNSESSESTSGCSSLIPQINRHEGPSNLLYSSTFPNRKRHIDDKLTFTNHLQSPRSLFLDSNSRDTLSSRRPSFNASVMTNALDRASPLSSPFYSGNITFGGANAADLYKRGRNLFNDSSELQLKVPRRTNVEVKPSTNAAGVDSSGMSQTAKKILEALEHFSSPISDAKKIPLKRASNTMSSIMSRKRAREEVASPSARIGLRHLTRELTVPTVPDILKLKRRQKLQDTTVAARRIVSARSDPPPLPQEYRLRTEGGENEKYRGKLNSKSKINLEKEETVAPVNLPNIPLPITTLPSFNFTLPSPTAHISSATVANKENTFTFASPIKVTDAAKSLQSVNNFTFSNPIDAEDNANNTAESSSSSMKETKGSTGASVERAAASMPNFIWSASSTAPRLKAKVKNGKDDRVGFELKSGSVMDVLCPKNVESNLTGQSNAKSPASGGTRADKTASSDPDSGNAESFWECGDCMIRNGGKDKQCIACKVARRNPDEKTPPPSTSTTEKAVPKLTANESFGSQFRLLMNQWECTICCVRNNRSDAKCVACSAPRPASNQTLSSIIKPQIKSDLMMEKFKPAEGSWECSGCLLRNAASVITCPCCNTSKPTCLRTNSRKTDVVAEPPAQKSSVAGGAVTQGVVTSGSDIMNKFKPSKDSWECPGCLVRNNSSVTACPCCNTAKPGSDAGASKTEQKTSSNGFGDLMKKPAGAWSCDTCLLQNDAKQTQCVACEALKPGTTKSSASASSSTTSTVQFKFGVPPNASGSANQAGGFKFGIDKADQPKSDGASPLNGFKFGSSQPLNCTSQFTFGVPTKEESKAANEASNKTNVVAASTDAARFSFKVTNLESAKQEQETSFGTPQGGTSTAIEKSGTALSATTPFTFGVHKPGFAQPDLETQKTPSVTTGTDSSKLTATTTVAAVSVGATVFATNAGTIPISTAAVLPPLPKTHALDAKPIFSFGAAAGSGITTAASNTSTSTTTCLPAFAQSSFTFSDSKTASQPAAIATFGQGVPPAAQSTKLFGANKIAETPAPSPSKPVSATSASTIFPIVSSSTSLFNSSESKKTTAFGMDKPSAGFALSENKISTFGSNSPKGKPSIFGTLETTKLPGFSSPAQTSVASPLPSFGAPSSATPAATPSLFGSSNTTFGSNSAATFSGTATTPAIFSSTKPSETTTPAASNPSLFTFGSSSQQSTSSGFNFSANTNATGSEAKPLFTFGSGASTSQGNNVFGSGTFGASSSAPTSTANFTFNPAKQEAAPTAFGQSAVAAPLFGAQQVTPQTQATSSFSSTSSSSAGFNFGSTAAPTATPGGFNFGGMPSTSTPAGGFNFNPPTSTPTVAFDPNSRPSFNFTKGSAPTSFNATPQSATAPRKIKKAFRRCMR